MPEGALACAQERLLQMNTITRLAQQNAGVGMYSCSARWHDIFFCATKNDFEETLFAGLAVSNCCSDTMDPEETSFAGLAVRQAFGRCVVEKGGVDLIYLPTTNKEVGTTQDDNS